MLKILAAAGIALSAITLTAGADAAGHGGSSPAPMSMSPPPIHMQAPGMMMKAPAHRIKTRKGIVLADWRGYALYTFGKDPRGAGISTCYGKCAIAWPPFRAPMNAKAFGRWTVIHRAFFGNQWAYNGKPLYFWFKDTRPGQVTGDGVNGFRVAR